MASSTDKQAKKATGQPDAVDRAAAMLKESIDEWSTATKASFDRALSGTYTAEQFAGDVAGAWARAVRDMARLMTAASSLTTFAAKVPTKQDPAAKPSTSKRSSEGGR
jgi:hypothetical protein